MSRRRRTNKKQRRSRKPNSPIKSPVPNIEPEIPYKPNECPSCHMKITDENATAVLFEKDGENILQVTCYGCGAKNQWSRVAIEAS